MAQEEHKSLARQALEQVWGQGDLSLADQIFARDFVSHQHSRPDETRDLRGVESLKAFVREFREAFPDFRDTVDDQIAEGDKVVTRFTSSGTHRGSLMGVAATGRPVSWMGITIDRIDHGQIVENWVSWDLHGLLEALAGDAPTGGAKAGSA
jgi:steroid delta-isomerase-like uncharacterized protein